ncbi:hypothetical protein [Tindallia californiensis]|uniref:Uncharacterized protein n=1 Tax=Tindallia californiensis TaxID=159292 RepID=A0A1H3R0V0_9FIRM|nr:hypothetical protein [Tindallia californiensis]SDZ19240.1 hypothetical protein SAMN05192546_11172 [Tindallia californiensis]
MKAKVLKRFRDKHTKERYAEGQEIELNEERLNDINSTSHGVLVEKLEDEPEKEEPEKEEEPEEKEVSKDTKKPAPKGRKKSS